MKDLVWIFRSFGFRAGVKFIWDSFLLKIRRASTKEKPMRFEDLSDAEAEKVAWAFGIHKWDDRDHLNRVWHKFEKTLN